MKRPTLKTQWNRTGKPMTAAQRRMIAKRKEQAALKVLQKCRDDGVIV